MVEREKSRRLLGRKRKEEKMEGRKKGRRKQEGEKGRGRCYNISPRWQLIYCCCNVEL